MCQPTSRTLRVGNTLERLQVWIERGKETKSLAEYLIQMQSTMRIRKKTLEGNHTARMILYINRMNTSPSRRPFRVSMKMKKILKDLRAQ
jgi:hypothetical protein